MAVQDLAAYGAQVITNTFVKLESPICWLSKSNYILSVEIRGRSSTPIHVPCCNRVLARRRQRPRELLTKHFRTSTTSHSNHSLDVLPTFSSETNGLRRVRQSAAAPTPTLLLLLLQRVKAVWRSSYATLSSLWRERLLVEKDRERERERERERDAACTWSTNGLRCSSRNCLQAKLMTLQMIGLDRLHE